MEVNGQAPPHPTPTPKLVGVRADSNQFQSSYCHTTSSFPLPLSLIHSLLAATALTRRDTEAALKAFTVSRRIQGSNHSYHTVWYRLRGVRGSQRRRLPGRLCQSCVFHDLLEFAILQASSPRQRDVQGPGPTSRTASPGLRGSPPGPFAAARTATGSGREAGALRPRPGQARAGGGSHRDRGPAGRDRAGRESARQELAGPTAPAPSLTKTHR